MSNVRNIGIALKLAISAVILGSLYVIAFKPFEEKLEPKPTFLPQWVSDTLYFAVSSTEPLPEFYPVLEKIAKNNKGRIVVIGGADSVGSEVDNWKLAMNRASSVREMLIGLQVPSDSILTIGYGERRPLLPKQPIQYNRYTIIRWRIQ